MEKVLTEIWRNREESKEPEAAARRWPNLQLGASEEKDANIFDNISSLHQLYSDLPEKQRFRQVAIDVVQFHMASQANMYAALAWAFTRLLTEKESRLEESVDKITRLDLSLRKQKLTLADVRVLEPDSATQALNVQGVEVVGWIECVIQESLRLAQQSITLRKVMKPMHFSTEVGDVTLEPGVYIGTLLSVTNVDALHLPPSAKPATWDDYCPSRYEYKEKEGARDKANYDRAQIPRQSENSIYNVSTFGHGFHACPGQRFAMHVIKVACSFFGSLLSLSSLTPHFSCPRSWC